MTFPSPAPVTRSIGFQVTPDEWNELVNAVRHLRGTDGDIYLENDLGIGVSTGPIRATTGGLHLSIKGTSKNGIVELATAEADAADVTMGVLQFCDVNSTSGDLRAALILSALEGTTANNRGSRMVFHTKADAGALTERMRINRTGGVFIGDTANAGMTQGLTINQGANDDEILALKSSDVAHGITALAETDTFGTLAKAAGLTGGVVLSGYSEQTAGVSIIGYHTTDDTGKLTSSSAACVIGGALKSGTGVTDLGANANILAVVNRNTTRFILDADGDSHQDVGTAWTNFDTEDDVLTLNALAAEVSRPDDPLRAGLSKWLGQHRDRLEELRLVTFNDDGHHFVNMSRLTMLLVGAVRQVGTIVEAHQKALQSARLLPEVA